MELIGDNKILKINILQKNYKILSKIIIKLQTVIKKNENILFYDNNQCIGNLNEIIKKLNETYNKLVLDIFSNDINNNDDDNISISDEENNLKKDMIILDNIKFLSTLTTISRYGKYNKYCELSNYDPFNDIKQKIIELCNIVGFTSIDDVLYLTLNIEDHTDKNNPILLLLNDVFIPLKYEIQQTDIESVLKISKIHDDNLILFNNQCEIELNINSTLITMRGYVTSDMLNIYIRTSQIMNNFLYEKKILFENILNVEETDEMYEKYAKIQYINKEFA
jgi:hypothetical protein